MIIRGNMSYTIWIVKLLIFSMPPIIPGIPDSRIIYRIDDFTSTTLAMQNFIYNPMGYKLACI